MSRLLLTISALGATLALAAPAGAQEPTEPPAGEPLADARLDIKVESGRVDRKVRWVLEDDKLLVRGHIWPYVKGQDVRLVLYRAGERLHTKTVKVLKDETRKNAGKYQYRFKNVTKEEKYTVRAFHDATAEQQAGASEKEHFRAIEGHVSGEQSTRLLQLALRSMAFVSPLNGELDDATRRAVLAWRKVNRWEHNGSPTPGMFREAFNGEGEYKPRYSHPEKHVEGDIDRQVLVLIDNKKPVQIYTTSTGKPSTPTVQGKFRFYRQEPGTNNVGMYYSWYFYRGYAIHGYPSVPATYPASHGCLRVPIPDAYRIYNWIDYGDTIYTFD
jgi:L,D-transpeptidase catalytic domain